MFLTISYPSQARAVFIYIALALALFVTRANAQTVAVSSSQTAHTISNNSPDSLSVNNPGNDTSSIVTSFEEFNMPPEMIMHFEQISPKEMMVYKDEFQVTQVGDDSLPQLITVKLWYNDNHLQGYIFESPLDNTSQATLSKFTVNIPLEWCCTPANTDHPQHCVKDVMNIKATTDSYKCKGWHIKMPMPEAPVPVAKDKKKKKKSSSKKPAPFQKSVINAPVTAQPADTTTQKTGSTIQKTDSTTQKTDSTIVHP